MAGRGELTEEAWSAIVPLLPRSEGRLGGQWRAHWARVIPLFAFPADIRKVIYTTNATLVAE